MSVRTDLPGAVLYTYTPGYTSGAICRTCNIRTSGWMYVDPDYYHMPCGHGAPPRPGVKLDPTLHALALLKEEGA
jgi:hypothetical protein